MTRTLSTLVAGALLVAACTGSSSTVAISEPEPSPAAASAAQAAPSEEEEEIQEYPDAIVRRMRRLANEPRPVENSALPPRQLDTEQFPTSLIPRDRIVSGGPPPDGIPSIDDPVFEPVDEVDWLADEEPVLALRVGDEVRAYPVQVMMWHEIVNDTVDDTVDGVPVAVTYCPLCNSAVAFDRRVDGRLLEFGTSGALYQSAMVMYDRQTESLWTHFDGRAVVGDLVGAQLELLPVSTVSWSDFRTAHPDAQVLSRDTGVDRPYGTNPYGAYDQRDEPLIGFFIGDPDTRTAAMRRIVGVNAGDTSLAIATDALAEQGVIETELDDQPVTVWHVPGTASALNDRQVAEGDDVGATGVFVAEHDSRELSFTRRGERFVDEQTGSAWNILGEAVDGPLEGARLDALPHVDTFWFAWATYRPDTTLLD
ncbi:MAG: DUF3179 domain-containing protein [Actinobacteria bacterium]|nr:DUF3179 domain-containing protein [Actinomycetota bacterium]